MGRERRVPCLPSSIQSSFSPSLPPSARLPLAFLPFFPPVAGSHSLCACLTTKAFTRPSLPGASLHASMDAWVALQRRLNEQLLAREREHIADCCSLPARGMGWYSDLHAHGHAHTLSNAHAQTITRHTCHLVEPTASPQPSPRERRTWHTSWG